MSDHQMMNHGADEPSREPTETGWQRFLTPRTLAIGVTVVVLVVGFLLARKLGVGSRLLTGIGLAAFMFVGSSLMHRGRGSHGGHGSHGGNGSHGGHGSHGGGCGSSSERSTHDRPTTATGLEPKPGDDDPGNTRSLPRASSGCH